MIGGWLLLTLPYLTYYLHLRMILLFFQPVELVTTCTLTMLGALEVVRAAYCAL